MARNKYPEETVNLIIDTAAKLFLEKGYEQTSIQDIIDNLGGLSKGAIYYHFKSKVEILNAVAERMYGAAQAEMFKIRERTDLNGLEKLKLVFRASVFSGAQKQLLSTVPDMMKNSLLLTMFLQDSVQTDSPEFIKPILEEGIADGSIKTEYPGELAEVLMLLANVWINPMIYHCSLEKLYRKIKFFQYTLRCYGLDVIDDAMVQEIKKFGDVYQKNLERTGKKTTPDDTGEAL